MRRIAGQIARYEARLDVTSRYPRDLRRERQSRQGLNQRNRCRFSRPRTLRQLE
jgi:hypothetical protein